MEFYVTNKTIGQLNREEAEMQREKELGQYLVHIYKCDRTCLKSGFGTEVMFMTEGELSNAILYAHLAYTAIDYDE